MQEMSIPVNHEDFIQDVAYNFYGTRLATCGSDKTIKIWDWNKQTKLWILNESINAHDSAVIKLSWAHPEFGQILASCSLDRTVKIWMESDPGTSQATSGQKWQPVSTLTDSNVTVHSIAFAPEYTNLTLAAASSDGQVRFYSPIEPVTLRNWSICDHIDVVPGGASDSDGPLCVSWCKSRFTNPHMIVVGGSKGNKVRIYKQATMQCVELLQLDQYTGYVLDVDWAPAMGRSYHLIATACSDGHVRIYKVWTEPPGKRTKSLFIHEGDGSDDISESGSDFGDDDDDDDRDGNDSDADGENDDADKDSSDSSGTSSTSSISDSNSDEEDDDNIDIYNAGNIDNVAGSEARSELTADLIIEPAVPVRRVRWNSAGTLLVSSSDDGIARVWKMAGSGVWREAAAVSGEEE